MKMKSVCPICCETEKLYKRKCCNNEICNTCQINHIKSVISEGFVGDGRKSMLCPLGCGKEMIDKDILTSFRQHHFSYFKHIIGRFIFNILLCVFSCCRQGRQYFNRNHYKWFTRLTRSSSECDDIDLYERWSTSMAMSTQTKHTRTQEFILRCPAPDCKFFCILSRKYRLDKLQNEPKNPNDRSSEKTNNNIFMPKLVKKASDWLFFNPPQIMDEQKEHNKYFTPNTRLDVTNAKGVITEEDNAIFDLPWLNSEDIYFQDVAERTTLSNTLYSLRRRPIQIQVRHNSTKDARRFTCPKCHSLFCSLCLSPWNAVVSRERNGTTIFKRKSHENKPCHSYSKSITGKLDTSNFALSTSGLQYKVCPGCGEAVQRITGCNHMTCRCGYQWCYVCETRWSNTHYGCVLRENGGDNGFLSGCCIS